MNARVRTLTLTTLMLWCVPGVYAETIIKLNLGTDSMPDVRLVDGVLSTAPDAVGATNGDQNTEVAYLGVLTGEAPIEGENGSLTLAGVELIGEPAVYFESTVLQETSGGSFQLYNPNNELLLSGNLRARYPVGADRWHRNRRVSDHRIRRFYRRSAAAHIARDAIVPLHGFRQPVDRQ